MKSLKINPIRIILISVAAAVGISLCADPKLLLDSHVNNVGILLISCSAALLFTELKNQLEQDERET